MSVVSIGSVDDKIHGLSADFPRKSLTLRGIAIGYRPDGFAVMQNAKPCP